MSSIPQILNATLTDFGTLARQYADLAQIKVKDSAKSLSVGTLLLAISAGLGIIVFGELLAAVAVWIVAGNVTFASRAIGLAAAMTGLAAAIFGFLGAIYLRRIDVNPLPTAGRRTGGFGPGEEDMSWETIT